MITLIIFCRIGTNSQVKPRKFLCSKQTLLDEWNKLDKFISLAKKKQPDFSFYVALVYNGNIISEKKMGYANLERRLKMNKKAVHKWGSVSKLFTAIAILQLVEKGKIKLNDPITHFFPNLGKQTGELEKIKPVKIHHLLNHNSGLTLTKAFRASAKKIKEEEKEFRRAENEEFLPYLALAEQVFPAGGKYEYSNMGYSLLGLLIEKVSGIKFKTYIKQNILIPLRMSNTSYGPLSKKLMKKFVIQYVYYDFDQDGKREKKPYFTNYSQGVLAANGGVRSSPDDMLKFMNFLRFRKTNKRIEKVLKNETLKKYLFEVNLADTNSNQVVFIEKIKNESYYYTNGFKVRANDQSISMGHSGKVGNYMSYFHFNKKSPFGVMMISNMYSDPKGVPYKLVWQVMKLVRNFSINGNLGKIPNEDDF